MKKKFLPLLLLPLLLSSCGGSGVSFKTLKAKIDIIDSTPLNPSYTVVGSLDFNGQLLNINQNFNKGAKYDDQGNEVFSPYAAYNEGFYVSSLDNTEPNPEDIIIYGISSKSYWLRAPLRIHKDNFYAEVVDEKGATRENTTCAHYLIQHIITSYIGQTGATNPSKNQMQMEITSRGFAFYGNEVHTKLFIDNYPFYPDYESHPELPDWDPDLGALPCYNNVVNAKVNIRLEYNEGGWLIKEEMSSVGYNYNADTTSQVALKAVYSYNFGN